MRRLLLLLVGALLFLPVWAEAAENAAMRSLRAFFAAGVVHDGAVAELASVDALPDTTGPLRWRLPRLHRFPRRFSLIAEELRAPGSGVVTRRWFVPVEVRWMAVVAVARRDIPARTVLDPSMMTLRRVDIAGHDAGFSSLEAVDGLRLLRRLRRGAPLFLADTHRLPLIRRGQLVTIEARFGPVQVTTVGKALRSAARGDLLLVENLRSKRQVEGRVINARTVRVVSGGAG